MEFLIPILISLMFPVLFTGMEIIFATSDKPRAEADRNLPSRISSVFARRQSRFIGALLLGNTAALVIYGIWSARLWSELLQGIVPSGVGSEAILMILQTVLTSLVFLLVAGFIPRLLFRINPDSTIKFLALPAYMVYLTFYPVISLLIGLSELLLKLLSVKKTGQPDYSFSTIDLDRYLRDSFAQLSAERDDSQEIQMFQNARDLGNIKLRECMVPRNEIAAINDGESIEVLHLLFSSSGHSKIPVYHDTIDNVIGYVHLFDLFGKPAKISDVVKPVMIVPETMPANKLLNQFIAERKSVALVVDEFGGTAGMLTIEDIIEEIFGEIEDEFDVEDLIENQLDENEFLFSGRLEIDYLNQKYGLKLAESDDYETLAGYIIHHHESIPAAKEEIRIDGFLFTIVKATDTRIEQVLLRLIPT